MYGYIYITTNLVNGKKYIGQKKSKVFLGNQYLGSGFAILDSISKYGRDNFNVELLEECSSEDELNDREKYWIDKFDAVESRNFYNLKEGGRGFASSDISRWQKGSKRSDESRARMSEVKSGSNNPFYGMHHSEESKAKLSESNSGSKHWNYGNKYGRAMFEGHNHTDEARKKISEASKNRRYINNGIITKAVSIDKLDDMLAKGWKRGIVKRVKSATTIESIASN